MFDRMIDILKKDETNWAKVRDMFVEKEIPAKTILLHEGEISTHLYFIKKGCLRIWFNKDGREVTFQFFFENQAVSSIDSLLSGQPGMFTIESIEPTVVYILTKDNFEKLLKFYPLLKDGFQDILFQRFRNYAGLFLSMIKDTPRQRYDDLIRNHPEIIKRIPQHYIASYLGITPVSLSRIKNRN